MKLLALGIAALVAGAFSLPSCSTKITIDPATVTADAKSVCAFVPTATTIASVISSNPTLTTAEAIAAAICAAIEAQVPAKERRGVVADQTDHEVAVLHIHGKDVPIIGHFTN